MIWVTGDTHGEFHRLGKSNFPESDMMGKDDYLIILGDFGGVWDLQASAKEMRTVGWLNQAPFTTLFIDGNHENFDRLLSDEFEEVEMFGDKVKQISDTVYYLQRGRVYDIDGTTINDGGTTAVTLKGIYQDWDGITMTAVGLSSIHGIQLLLPSGGELATEYGILVNADKSVVSNAAIALLASVSLSATISFTGSFLLNSLTKIPPLSLTSATACS